MNPSFKRPIPGALAIAASLVLLAACDKSAGDRTAGQQLDSGVAKIERQADQIAADARSAGRSVAGAVGSATEAAADKVKDAAITTEVSAKIAADVPLQSLNVDTVNGHVTLNGTAPDAASRDKAGQLAARVDGVVAVDNRLVVSASG